MAITWTNWVSTNATTSGSTSNVWYYWTDTTAATGTGGMTVQNTVWASWQNGTAATTVYPQRYIAADPYANETPEEKEVRLAAQAEREAKFRRTERRRRIRAEIAKLRAERLLHAVLTEEQSKAYEETRAFEVKVRDPRSRSFRSFRINHGSAGNVTELDENGRPTYKYCIHPREYVPDEDTMLAQLMMLQNDIEQFERIANRSRAYASR